LVSGVQSRLENLGYPCAVTGESDDPTLVAVRMFRSRNRLSDDEDPDPDAQEDAGSDVSRAGDAGDSEDSGATGERDQTDQPDSTLLTPIVHKVARQVVNPIAPPPVRTILEPSLQSQDEFFLEPNKGTKPTTGGVKFSPISTRSNAGKTHTVVEFEQIRDAAIYRLVHYRGSGGQADAERDIVDGHLPGATLTHPQWKTPGPPSRQGGVSGDSDARQCTAGHSRYLSA
jgi:hypothetical protein